MLDRMKEKYFILPVRKPGSARVAHNLKLLLGWYLLFTFQSNSTDLVLTLVHREFKIRHFNNTVIYVLIEKVQIKTLFNIKFFLEPPLFLTLSIWQHEYISHKLQTRLCVKGVAVMANDKALDPYHWTWDTPADGPATHHRQKEPFLIFKCWKNKKTRMVNIFTLDISGPWWELFSQLSMGFWDNSINICFNYYSMRLPSEKALGTIINP